MQNESKGTYVGRLSIALAVILVLGVGPAMAQPAPKAGGSGPDTIEEVVVTAEKRTESAQRTPAAVTVVMQNVLLEQNITNVKGIEELLPSASIQTERHNLQMFIRGVGQIYSTSNFDSGVAMNIDGIFQNRDTTAAGFYDVSSVEILPGPQGTLYGRGATGGVVNITTNKPNDSFGGYVNLDVGNYNLIKTEGAVNVPITDELSVRLAFENESHDGYYTSGAEDSDVIAGRVSVLYTPTANLSILLRASYWHDGGVGYGAVDYPFINPSNPWFQDGDSHSRVIPPQDLASASFSGNIEYTFGNGFSLTWLPGVEEFNGITGTLQGSYITRGDTLVEHANSREVTNEVRLAQDTDQYHWLVGLYQLAADAPRNYINFNYSGYVNQAPPGEQISIGPYTTDWKSYAAYTQGTYSILPWLRATGGVRFSYDEKSANGIQTFALTGEGNPLYLSEYGWTFEHVYHNVSWKAGVEADLSDRSLLYASISTGYLQGGYELFPNLAVTHFGPSQGFKPEIVTAFTLGIKNRFFGDRLQINDEFFYYDYSDYQAPALNLVSGLITVYSLTKSTIYGDDLDVKYLLTHKLELNASVGYLHTEIIDAVFPNAGFTNLPAIVNLKGFDLPYSPEFQATAGLQYTYDLANGGSLMSRVSTHFESQQWLQLNHPINARQDATTMTDLLVEYTEPKGRWKLGMWAKNLENTAKMDNEGVTAVPNSMLGYLEPPRTFGARFSVNF